MVHKLKASCLLLDSYGSERFSMHDVVHDVAILIASRDHHVLMGRNDMISREWPGEDTLRKCTTIILSNGDTSELPEDYEGGTPPRITVVAVVVSTVVFNIALVAFIYVLLRRRNRKQETGSMEKLDRRNSFKSNRSHTKKWFKFKQ
ncbi:hypothetical protein LWI29_022695 [Acer saccharum]|uniref:Uncharacterized protein n=1 Tax=Acer saccharum TaxID=4024 RepID=A0AA39T5Q9_ACESA|nr:hypothetical protein LWI29_022695 [Acer saccharum]